MPVKLAKSLDLAIALRNENNNPIILRKGKHRVSQYPYLKETELGRFGLDSRGRVTKDYPLAGKKIRPVWGRLESRMVHKDSRLFHIEEVSQVVLARTGPVSSDILKTVREADCYSSALRHPITYCLRHSNQSERKEFVGRVLPLMADALSSIYGRELAEALVIVARFKVPDFDPEQTGGRVKTYEKRNSEWGAILDRTAIFCRNIVRNNAILAGSLLNSYLNFTIPEHINGIMATKELETSRFGTIELRLVAATDMRIVAVGSDERQIELKDLRRTEADADAKLAVSVADAMKPLLSDYFESLEEMSKRN